MRSNSGRMVSATIFDVSVMSLPSMSTLATITGIISGLSLIIVGVPTASSKFAFTMSMLPLISIMALSMLVPWVNSRSTMLEFSLDELVTVFTPLVVERVCSSGFVTVCSIFSGLAPG
ncbi:MAG: hypothetical protein DELT_03190 [Desulfovibrio sp.]